MYYLALRFLADPQKAEDVTHDVFPKVYRLGEFRGDSSIRTGCIASRSIIARTSGKAGTTEHGHHGGRRHLNTTAALTVPRCGVETKELGERIEKTLAGLRKNIASSLLLVADEELSYDEVAALTEQTSDAVRGKLHRARKAFAALFQQSA